MEKHVVEFGDKLRQVLVGQSDREAFSSGSIKHLGDRTFLLVKEAEGV